MKILAELRQECEQVEEAIMTLERLIRGRGKRRGPQFQAPDGLLL